MISDDNVKNGTLTPLEAGSKITIQLYPNTFEFTNQNYYIAMKVYDQNFLESGLSNIARIMIRPKSLDGGISGGQIAGVVIGSLLVGGFMIAVVAYYYILNKTQK